MDTSTDLLQISPQLLPETWMKRELINYDQRVEGADIFLDYLSDQSKSMSVLYRTQIS